MEFAGQARPSGACSLLGVPGLSSSDADDDDCEVVIGIRPKSSPLPRRRSSTSDEDSGPEPPLSGSRRVSFADAKGLSLVQVKQFDTWDIPKLPGCDFSEGEGKDAEEYFLSPLTFSLPVPTEELFLRVREQKVELEAVELLPGTTVLRGVIRVLNISFDKAVYIRTTLDTWSSHFDLLAEYMPGSSDSLMDLFSFKLTLVPPFGEQGARVDFCLRYETPVGTFWANNNNRNYVLFCHQRMRERREKPQKENVNKKSCLKTVGQNFSTVEDISATEASSTDVLKRGEETMKAKQISGGQSETSEEEQQKLLIKSKGNCSRRSRRKAARMARVRDYFSQRNGAVDDSERDESPPEAKQAAQEETSVGKHSDVRSFPEGKSLETCSEPLLDVQPALDFTSEKSESIDAADSTALTGSESVTGDPDNPSNNEPAPAECQNTNKSVSKAEECSSADEAADSVISAVSSESLVSQTNSFTFGTVVAPLYHQVFGRVGSESQSAGGWGNPVRATDLTQNFPEGRETTCTAPADTYDKLQEDAIKTQESNQECLDANMNTPPMEEEEKEEEGSLIVTPTEILDHAEILQDQDDIIFADQRCSNTSEVPKSISGDTVIHPQAVNILNTDLLNPQLPTEGLHFQGEGQEDNLTHDIQLQEDACKQLNLAGSEAEELTASLETSFKSLQPPQSVSERVCDETNQHTSGSGANEENSGKTVIVSTTNVITKEDKLLEADNYINNSSTKETENNYVSCFEIVEENSVTTPQISLETNNVEEGNKVLNNLCNHSAEIREISEVPEVATQATISNHVHEDMFMQLKDEDTQKIESHEKEAADAKQEDFYLAGAAALNWEMMVEEEEKNILTDEEKSEAIMVEEDHGKLEDAESETAAENRDTTETEKEKKEVEMLEDITAAQKKENKAEDADVLEGKLRTGEEEIGAGKDEVKEELENVQATKTDGEEEHAEEMEVENTEEQEDSEEEKHFAQIQEGSTGETNVQHEEEMEWEEEMEIDFNDDNEADVEWEDQVEPREGNGEEENSDYMEETGESELVDVESESRGIEDGENEAGCFEESLDITQNKVEDGLSAPVNNVQDERVTDIENGHIAAEMYLEDFQSSENVTHDLWKAASDERESVAAEGSLCLFADEPESDRASHDSASAESDSDDEVELYMHCLRAVHVGEQAQKDRSKEAGFSVGKRPSVSRSKLLSSPMPSISESLDEEHHLSCLQDKHEDTDTADFQPTAAALLTSSEKESTNRGVSWWRETFSCSNILKTLLYATLFVVFLVVAYRYDFLACFGLYLITVVWLYYQGQKQPEQQKQQQNRLN